VVEALKKYSSLMAIYGIPDMFKEASPLHEEKK